MLNPCCCISPRIGTFVFAILDLVAVVGYAWGLFKDFFDKNFQYEMWGEVALCVCLILLALLLLLGAIQNCAKKVQLWLILWLVFIIVAVIFQAYNVYSHHVGYRQGSSFGGLILFVYQCWVVYAYLTELRYPAGLTYCPTKIV